MNKKVIIMAMALLLVFVMQSQSHAEQRVLKMSGILKEVVFDINKSTTDYHAAFYFENGAMIVLANVPREGVVFEKGRMCLLRYASSEFRDGGYDLDRFVSIEYKNDVTKTP
ncbi:MAG: hypothetical protein WA064_05495 [Candidatus Moraniibacteriota bacterium]